MSTVKKSHQTHYTDSAKLFETNIWHPLAVITLLIYIFDDVHVLRVIPFLSTIPTTYLSPELWVFSRTVSNMNWESAPEVSVLQI